MNEVQKHFELKGQVNIRKDFIKANYGEKSITYAPKPGHIGLVAQFGGEKKQET